jgi:ABC-type sulfate transport system permease subunit
MEYSQDYSSEAAGIMAGIFGTIILIYLAIYVLMVVGLWKVFEKAGKPGWAAIIPIYNTIIMIEIVGKPTIWVLWCLIPCVNIVFGIWLINLMSKSYGEGEGFTVGLILLPFIFWPILGFGSSRYIGPSAAEAQNPFGGGQNPFNPNNPFNQSNNPFNQPPNTPQ